MLDTSDIRVRQIRNWLRARSLDARSISVSGNLTADQAGSSNSASFSLKDKRLDPAAQHRIDSLSIEVMGPFGIKVARFLASPERYQFNDILHGETMTGATDAHSLQELTQLNGVTLNMMSDLVYGLSPQGDDFVPQDSLVLYSNGMQHTLMIFRGEQNATEALDFQGSIPEAGSPIAPAGLLLVRYQRWNGIVPDPIHTPMKPVLTIRYSEHAVINGIPMPQRIEAKAAQNTLSLEYTDITLNPDPLTVRIKMPQ